MRGTGLRALHVGSRVLHRLSKSGLMGYTGCTLDTYHRGTARGTAILVRSFLALFRLWYPCEGVHGYPAQLRHALPLYAQLLFHVLFTL